MDFGLTGRGPGGHIILGEGGGQDVWNASNAKVSCDERTEPGLNMKLMKQHIEPAGQQG